jgi:tetratricopeptide (TPR) repeat protein
MLLGVGVAVILLQLPITLPLEADASRRARRMVAEAKLVGPHEQRAFDAMLNSAWLTHAAYQAQGCVFLLVVGVTFFVFPTFLSAPDSSPEAIAAAAERAPAPPPAPRPQPARPQPAPVVAEPPDDGPGPEILVFDSLYLFWSLLLGVAPCLLIYLVLTKLNGGGRKTKSDSQRAIERNNVGMAHFNQGALLEAVAAFDEALRLDPTLTAALFNRGQAHLLLRRLDAAQADFETQLRLSPGSPYALAGRGEVWATRGDLDRAQADYEAALQLAPENAVLLMRRGQVHLAKNQLDEAVAALSAALERDSRQAVAWRDRGLAWYHKGDHARAVADATEAILLAPSDALAFNNRGAAHLKAGAYAAARADFQEAIRLDPRLPNAHRHLAWLQATCPQAEFRDGAAAVANAVRALELNGGKPVEWFAVRAAAHAEAGDFAEAVEWQTRCLDESPPEAADALRARLELYQARQAYRDQVVS